MDQVETAVLELIEMGVCVLVGVLVTNGNAGEVAVGDDTRTVNVGEDDDVASAMI